MVGLEEIRKNYASFDDERIKRIARKDAKSLRPETVAILIAEINKRGLDQRLIKWINAERRILSPTELDDLKGKIKSLICTNCNKSDSHLKGRIFTTITGTLIDTIDKSYHVIICDACSKKHKRNAIIWTMIFGWWSVWGFMQTLLYPISIINRSFKAIEDDKLVLEEFIQQNIGAITLKNDSLEGLQDLLTTFNQSLEN